jgi:hypothetical protein
MAATRELHGGRCPPYNLPVKRFLYLLAVMMLAAGLFGCGHRYATPEDVFTARQKALAAKDWRRSLTMLTPESRDFLISSKAIEAVAFKSGDKEIAAVLKKHGVDPQRFQLSMSDLAGMNRRDLPARVREEQQRLIDAIQDKPGFYADFMAQMDKTGREGMAKAGLPPDSDLVAADTRLSEVTIEGDRARGTASVESAGKEIQTPVGFKKIGRSWYIDLLDDGS